MHFFTIIGILEQQILMNELILFEIK